MGDNFNASKNLKLANDIDAFDPHPLYGLGLAYQDILEKSQQREINVRISTEN